MIEGSRFAAASGRDGAPAKDAVRVVQYLPSAVNLPVD